ncbi:MAG: 30S ribosomal protein S4 [Puniceicoccales bacterium]|jgi:small subunit ribosomal protein S4|nr:30S ribosomal protein S4 [Puniceicoccales bacterium]
MSRYTGPKARVNRRFSQNIFPACKAAERKPYCPGQHGPRLRRRHSDYALGLNEKQKLRYMYGLTEKQFRLSFERAKKERGIVGEIFMRSLEMRLDSVVYLMGLARTRRAARQFVTHGHVMVDRVRVNIPSFICAPGHCIEAVNRPASKRLLSQNVDDTRYRNLPAWMSFNADLLKGQVDRVPSREEMTQEINGQLVVEFYSR